MTTQQQLQCPECYTPMEKLPIRPLTSNVGYYSSGSSGTYSFPLPSTDSTSTETYKCPDPTCWVTKVTISWS